MAYEYEFEQSGMTPEQKFGLATGAVLAVAGLAVSVFRRRRQKKSPIQRTADKIVDNPTLKTLLTTARESLDDARGRVDGQSIEDARREIVRQAEQLPATWKSEVEPHARVAAGRASDFAHRVRDEGAELSRDFASRWEKEYGPAARSFADDAISEADDIIKAAREKAGELSEVARKEYIPKLRPIAVAAGGALAGAVADGSDKLSKKLKDSNLKDFELPGASSLGNGFSDSRGVVRRVGGGVKDVTGQILMIGFWGAALGAVVYYGILDEERREKVRNFFNDSFEQVSELIEDFKDDDQFSADRADDF